jgi:ferredoxin-thioredoxin reductase catalytic subunit
MQGLISDKKIYKASVSAAAKKGKYPEEILVKSAISFADALLAELEKSDTIDLKPCPKCGKPSGEDESGAWICPCLHCGDEIPF